MRAKMLSKNIKKAYGGDKEALDMVILDTTKLREKIASKFDKNYYEDLLNEGVLGIIYGINNYGKSKSKYKDKLPYTYLSRCAYVFMKRYMQKNENLIRLPYNKMYEIEKINAYINKYLEENEKYPEIEEISKFTKFSKKHILYLFKFSRISFKNDIDNLSCNLSYNYEYQIKKLKEIISSINKNCWEIIYEKWLNHKRDNFLNLDKVNNVSRQTIKNRQDKCFKLLRNNHDMEDLAYTLNI